MEENTSLEHLNKLYIKKIGLFDRFSPFVFLKLDTESSRYRVSCNYKFLHEKFGLNINMIRNLRKINTCKDLFKIKNNVLINLNLNFKSFKIQVHENKNNYCIVHKYLYPDIMDHENEMSSLLIFQREYYNETSYSVLFISNKFFNLNSFINNWQKENQLKENA